MNQGSPPNDEERLPWLEPYRNSPAPRPSTENGPKTRIAALAVGVVAAIGVAMAGGYYLGQREQASPEPTLVAEAPVTVRPDRVAEPAEAGTIPVASSADRSDAVPGDAAPTDFSKTDVLPKSDPDRITSGPLKRSREAARQRALANLATERSRLRARRFAQEEAAAAAVAAATARPATQNVRPWPKMPSPGPAGQVVQLGAFRTEGRALAAWRTRLGRYPVLGSMPRVVVPVITKPRGQVLYVLRLGTASRQQSHIVCRNLKASGDHCIVIG